MKVHKVSDCVTVAREDQASVYNPFARVKQEIGREREKEKAG